MGYRVGIDIGGTFTDVAVFNERTRDIAIIKVPSTPREPALAITNALREAAEGGMNPEQVVFFSHGTTVGTKALLEGKGARVGVLLTAGFRGINDVYQVIAGRTEMYKVYEQTPKGLVASRFCEEIRERIDFKGQVVTPLDEEQARQAVIRLKEKKVEAIAVCLLFSFINPSHECELKEIIKQEYPECDVYLSSEILPQIREFTRLSTTIVSAQIGPVVEAYLTSLETRLKETGLKVKHLYVMQNNGGITSFSACSRRAVTTVLSGPAAGAIAACRIAILTGHTNTIGLDMGGTSCNISLIKEGQVANTTKTTVGKWEIGVPMLEINTIGGGGGTIAKIDESGMLRLGPESASTEPGPVCYDRGGKEVTVTDANVVLGYINPEFFLGGKQQLNKQKAERAIEKKIAKPLHLKLKEAAYGIVRVANAHIEQGIRAICTERGYDLRQFILIAFGGAGPGHATQLAEALGISKVLVPLFPGVASAEGLLGSDIRHDYLRRRVESMSAVDVDQVNREFAELRNRAVTELVDEGLSEEEITLSYCLDLRYAGQGYEVTVPAPSGSLAKTHLAAIRALFDELHDRLFGYKAQTRPVEIVNYHVVSSITMPKIEPRKYERAARTAEVAIKERRVVYFGNSIGDIMCPIYKRELLGPGHIIDGPAIIEQTDSTTVIYPKQRTEVDAYRNLIILIPRG